LAAHTTIAVVGAGFSGTALALRLLEVRPPVEVLLIERSGVFGRGLAYSTPYDSHLLNVRSGRMSWAPEDPGHFVRWLERTGADDPDPDGFTRRSTYGRYMQDLLDDAAARAGARLTRIAGEVAALGSDADGVVLTLADRRRVRADRAVIATGNPPPDAPAAEAGSRRIDDPWAPGALASIGADEDVVLIGTGLTAVDVLLALREQGWTGRALALSRRGLLPRSHDRRQAHVEAAPPAPAPLSDALHRFRAEAAGTPWGELMDRLRPHGQALWTRLSPDDRRRFLEHLRAWWDVHRHRTAPRIGEAVAALRAEGRLTVAAGRVRLVEEDARGLTVTWRPRGSREDKAVRAGRLVTCTGPLTDPSRATDRLTADLLARGLARPDPLRLGLDVDARCRLIGRDGRADERLYALGPPTRGRFWEIVAVPDIREQALRLADELAGAAQTAEMVSGS